MKLLAEIKREDSNHWKSSCRQLLEDSKGEYIVRRKDHNSEKWITFPSTFLQLKDAIDFLVQGQEGSVTDNNGNSFLL